MKLQTKISIFSIALLGLFITYVLIFFRSGLNTLRVKPDHETIEYQLIEEDLEQRTNYFTWIGQATILLDIEGTTFLFDPIFSERASPFTFIGPKRNIPPVIDIDNLPKIDYVFISHNHYDHLDIDSLIKLSQRNPLTVFNVPKGDKKLLSSNSILNVLEYEWWESNYYDEATVTFTPSNHWSARGLFDRKNSLWGGWHITYKTKSIIHIGDTAVDDVFQEFQRKLGRFDIAFLPIGSYSPREIEAEYHVDPLEAFELAETLDAELTIGMHWGGIFFTQEPTYEPLEIILELNNANPSVNFQTPLPGIVINLD